MKKKFNVVVLVLLLSTLLIACASKTEVSNSGSETKEKISIAYQYGLSYAPLVFCKNNKLVEKNYKALTGKDIEVTWNQMSAGADINVGIASGNLDAGFMGVSVALIGIGKKVGYKIFTNVYGQEQGLMTYNNDLKTLADVVNENIQVATVNLGSFQHIVLAMALVNAGFDAHALDANIVAMKHPDAMSALLSRTIPCHLTCNPYVFQELEDKDVHEIVEIKKAWPKDKTHIVGIAGQKLHDEKPEVYQALCNAISESIDTINSDFVAAAKVTCEYDGNDSEKEAEYLKNGCYTDKTHGVMEVAKFMYENGFLDNKFNDFSEVAFDNVIGD